MWIFNVWEVESWTLIGRPLVNSIKKNITEGISEHIIFLNACTINHVIVSLSIYLFYILYGKQYQSSLYVVDYLRYSQNFYCKRVFHGHIYFTLKYKFIISNFMSDKISYTSINLTKYCEDKITVFR